MKDELSEEEAQKILKAIERALAEGPWDASNFLKVIGKNLQEMRDFFASHTTMAASEKSKIVEDLTRRLASREGQQELYIRLYSAEGSSLAAWERIIFNLPKQMISRPIYDNEQSVQDIIKTKENRLNEGYVSFFVKKSDILFSPAGRAPIDALGSPLVLIKDRAISIENIAYFVHQSGVYDYINGRLVRRTDG